MPWTVYTVYGSQWGGAHGTRLIGGAGGLCLHQAIGGHGLPCSVCRRLWACRSRRCDAWHGVETCHASRGGMQQQATRGMSPRHAASSCCMLQPCFIQQYHTGRGSTLSSSLAHTAYSNLPALLSMAWGHDMLACGDGAMLILLIWPVPSTSCRRWRAGEAAAAAALVGRAGQDLRPRRRQGGR